MLDINYDESSNDNEILPPLKPANYGGTCCCSGYDGMYARRRDMH